ncbi:hypothetical protein KKH15_03060 [Patescibacteria group bacterium]|nr:hypothetical protein [Patescibacteria group bacterium]MBU1755262.1 hypothetical protein [Patescibacteria group bacterium]
MKRHTLREVAKVGVGLITADLLSVLWFSGAGFFPLTVLGITWSESTIIPIIIVDLVLIALLAHFSWNMKFPVSSPKEKTLLLIVGAAFLIIALLHLVRIAFGWELVLSAVSVPVWVSWLGVAIPGYLSYSCFHFALKR